MAPASFLHCCKAVLCAAFCRAASVLAWNASCNSRVARAMARSSKAHRPSTTFAGGAWGEGRLTHAAWLMTRHRSQEATTATRGKAKPLLGLLRQVAMALVSQVAVGSISPWEEFWDDRYTAASRDEVQLLREQVGELLRITRTNYDLQLDIRRCIRQEVAAALHHNRARGAHTDGAGDGVENPPAAMSSASGPTPVINGRCVVCIDATGEIGSERSSTQCACSSSTLDSPRRAIKCLQRTRHFFAVGTFAVATYAPESLSREGRTALVAGRQSEMWSASTNRELIP